MGHGYFVRFFGSEDQHTDSVAWFVKEALDAGSTALSIATRNHHGAVEERLGVLGIQVAQPIAAYQYIQVDANPLLTEFLDGAHCNRQKFHAVFDVLLRQAASRGAPVFIYSEMMGLLAQQDLSEAVLELEDLWSELSRHHHFTLFCGYSDALLPTSIRMRQALERIRAIHNPAAAL